MCTGFKELPISEYALQITSTTTKAKVESLTSLELTHPTSLYSNLIKTINTKMGAFYETIPPSLLKWILDQKVFWVATAPLSPSGHINISPKGGQYFGILNPTTFWYLDLTGSGIETLSHLHEKGNGRITVQFNAFEGPPQIVRLWGKGEVLEYGSNKFISFVEENKVDAIAGTRAVILVHIHQVGSSCGFSMPFYDFKAFRSTLNEFAAKRVAAEERGNKKDGIER
jgi:hypothetical protein